MCSVKNFSPLFDPFPHFQVSWQNFLAPANLSNLSFLARAEQLICRTPSLAASELWKVLNKFCLSYWRKLTSID